MDLKEAREQLDYIDGQVIEKLNPLLLSRRRLLGSEGFEIRELNGLTNQSSGAESRVALAREFEWSMLFTSQLFQLLGDGISLPSNAELAQQLEAIDLEIIRQLGPLIKERLRLSKILALDKLDKCLSIVQPAREADVINERVQIALRLGWPAEFTTQLFRAVINESVRVQREVWQMTPPPKKRILTGIRPTGALHLGHYAGALEKWLELEDQYECFFLIADYQALGDHSDKPDLIRRSVIEVALDWLAVGLDPNQSSFVVQSYIPEHAELTMLLSMITPLPWLVDNPTLKAEMASLESEHKEISVGFFNYPMSQIADILLPKGDLVPVGEDQNPHIERARRVARRFNRIYKARVFPVPKVLVGRVPRLVGLDGRDKMSKSKGNTIQLGDDAQTVTRKVMSMFTDITRKHATDPGHVEGNPVFIYHDAFNPDKQEVEDLKERYQSGRISDVEVKQKLARVLNILLEPIRDRRAYYEARPAEVVEALAAGTARAKKIAEATMAEVREVMKITNYGVT